MHFLRSSVLLVLFCMTIGSCKKYLDLVPDNVATIDYAFRQRSTAEQYLFTCYSYMPKHGDISTNPAFMGGDEFWFFYPYRGLSGYTVNVASWEISRGEQSVTSPLTSYWTGSSGASDLYQGLRDCNIFLKNISKVPVMEQFEKDQWSAEVNFLKAYYHFWLLRMYGPIPIVDNDVPIDVTQEETQVERMPVDSCFNYIVQKLDEAAAVLPDQVMNPANEMGRITRTIALAVKAQVLVTAASPLFNGNSSYPNFKNKAGQPFFNATVDPKKWIRATEACKAAVELCQSIGQRLHHYAPSVSFSLPAPLQTIMDTRTSVTENFNTEVVWGNTNSLASYIQAMCQPRVSAANASNYSFLGITSVPLHIVNQFYSKNGVPVLEDKTLDFATRGTQTRTAGANEQYRIYNNYVTAALNFDREPRFYSSLGFDGSILYGQGIVDPATLNHLEAKQGQYAGWQGTPQNYNITGYWPVKLVNHQNVMTSSNNTYTVTPYTWPVIRLADLYLMYAEALNESEGPSAETYRWIDSVRIRAGIPRLEEAWNNFSTNPSAYTSQDGLRKIIHTERTIELAFEGQRFWDLKRWKEAERAWRTPIQGWNIQRSDAQGYYQFTTLFNKNFQLKDYFWPLSENDLLTNKNLVQNPGW